MLLNLVSRIAKFNLDQDLLVNHSISYFSSARFGFYTFVGSNMEQIGLNLLLL